MKDICPVYNTLFKKILNIYKILSFVFKKIFLLVPYNFLSWDYEPTYKYTGNSTHSQEKKNK